MTTGVAPDLATAAEMLKEWGFLAAPDLPDRPGPAYLLVALRDRPALTHYDPEIVEYYVSSGGRGVKRTLDRDTRLPIDTEFSWGLIRIIDRLDVSNEYVTFGGHLSAADVNGMTVAVFTSPVPLLRRGGHSQPWDHGADSLAAFFGRMIVAVDFQPGFESRAAALDPVTRYAAFIGDLVGRYRHSTALRERDPQLWVLLRSEEERLARDEPAAWARGADLLRDVSSI